MKVWVGDRLWEAEDARVSPFDHAIITGDGVFETLKVAAGRPFAVRRHLERLARSAAGLGLSVPDLPTLRQAIDAVVSVNDVGEGVIRMTLTGGPSPLGSERGTSGARRGSNTSKPLITSDKQASDSCISWAWAAAAGRDVPRSGGSIKACDLSQITPL